MTSLTIKPIGAKGTTKEVGLLSVANAIDFFGTCKTATVYYQKGGIWHSLSAVDAFYQSKDIVNNSQRVVIHNAEKTLFPSFPEVLLPQAKRTTREELAELQYIRDIRARAERELQYNFLVTAEDHLKDIQNHNELRRDFTERLQSHLYRDCRYPYGLAWLPEEELALATESREAAREWADYWAKLRLEAEEDYQAYHQSHEKATSPELPEAEDTLIIGRFDARDLVKGLKQLKKKCVELPKGNLTRGFKQAHLIHLYPFNTGIEFRSSDQEEIETALFDGRNVKDLPNFHIAIVLEQLTNTNVYPAVLDLEKGDVCLEVNFSKKLLTVYGVESRYRVNLKCFFTDRLEDNDAVYSR